MLTANAAAAAVAADSGDRQCRRMVTAGILPERQCEGIRSVFLLQWWKLEVSGVMREWWWLPAKWPLSHWGQRYKKVPAWLSLCLPADCHWLGLWWRELSQLGQFQRTVRWLYRLCGKEGAFAQIANCSLLQCFPAVLAIRFPFPAECFSTPANTHTAAASSSSPFATRTWALVKPCQTAVAVHNSIWAVKYRTPFSASRPHCWSKCDPMHSPPPPLICMPHHLNSHFLGCLSNKRRKTAAKVNKVNGKSQEFKKWSLMQTR